MVKPYTPNIKIIPDTIIRKERIAPISGNVLVKIGEIVDSKTDVIEYNTPGNTQIINIADLLDIEVEDLPDSMQKNVGDKIEKGELLAKYSAFFGLLKKEYLSPFAGTLTKISPLSGLVVIQEPQIPIKVKAYIPGRVVDILPEEGVIIEAKAAYIQGIFGIGGETHGELALIIDSLDQIVKEEDITPDLKGKIVVCGSLITEKLIRKALKIGVRGLISGGINAIDLKKILGYEIGVAITGEEEIGLTIIITEGFGKIEMLDHIFNLLKNFEGSHICINGATQVRAGAIRPEIIIPLKDSSYNPEIKLNSVFDHLTIGTKVRIIREPYFGEYGKIIDLPKEYHSIETGSKVQIAIIKLSGNRIIYVPINNIEIISMSD